MASSTELGSVDLNMSLGETPEFQADKDTYLVDSTFPTSTHKAVGIYLVIVGILGTFGNGIIITMFIRFRTLLTPTNLLLITLAVSDLGIILFGFPFSASSSFANRWLFNEGGCQWYAFMGFLFGSAHIGVLALLGLDRYLITCRIDFRRKLTYKRYCQMICAVWVYAIFWSVMPLIGWGRYGPEPSITTCTIDWRHNDGSYKSFIIVYFVLGFLVPFLLIAICYFNIARQLSVKPVAPSLRSAICDQWANERNVTMMCLVIVITFVVSWSPYAIVCLWTVFKPPSTVPSVLTLIPPLFAKASTVFNPIIYYLTNPRLRMGIIATITCSGELPGEMIPVSSNPEATPETHESI
ncbi:visual pigment-like receptor peropsin [Limulus polyphemus]|uniref:Peropsin 1 n=1 Tax=Limulus polyphemus TaxID=6850 RepID=A0A097J9F3_LIMPO|nr:visual pigment-like receptor peropsin [Limulus polyphemus]AIT75833.1 peropsin 1 [Limulus polyphemus]